MTQFTAGPLVCVVLLLAFEAHAALIEPLLGGVLSSSNSNQLSALNELRVPHQLRPSHHLDDWEDWETYQPASDVNQGFPYYRMGYDDRGSVVYVVEFGKWNFTEWGSKSKAKQMEFWRYFEQHVRFFEKDAAAKNGKGVVAIVDFQGFSLSNHATTSAIKMDLGIFSFFDRLNKACSSGFFVFPENNDDLKIYLDATKVYFLPMLMKYEVCHTLHECKTKMLSKIPVDQLASKYGGENVAWRNLPFKPENP